MGGGKRGGDKGMKTVVKRKIGNEEVKGEMEREE
jgi:hypothetical protein